MKGLILSGGTGTRMYPLSFSRPKQMLPVLNKPLLEYNIIKLRSLGVTDIGIITNENENHIKTYFGTGDKLRVKLTYIRQNIPLGLAHAVLTAKDFTGQSPFIMLLGDNLIMDTLKNAVKLFHSQKPEAVLALAKVSNPSQFGVAQLESDTIRQLWEKPENPPSNWAVVGVYIFSPHIFEAIAVTRPSSRNELEITDAVQNLLNMDRTVLPYFLAGWWKDVGSPSDLLKANMQLLKTQKGYYKGVSENSSIDIRAQIKENTYIKNSTVRPSNIDTNCSIENSVISNSIIGPGCTIINSKIENSLIMGNCKISNVTNIKESVIGENCTVTGNASNGKYLRLVVGDYSFMSQQ